MTIKIHHSTFSAELTAEKIFNIKYKDSTISTIQDLKAGYDAYLDLANGTPRKVLIEVGKSAYFDIEANECIKEGKALPTAEAIVTESLAIRLMMDYYLYSRRNNHNVRIFKTRELALEWLATV